MIFASAVLAAAACLPAAGTADELSRSVYDREEVGRGFVLDATAMHVERVAPGAVRYHLRDASGATHVETKDFPRGHPRVSPGDRLVAKGAIELGPHTHLAYARCTNIAVVAHGPAPEPVRTTCAAINAGEVDFQLVTFEAVVRALVADQIDTRFNYLILGGDGATIPLSLTRKYSRRLFGDASPVGAKIAVTGLCDAAPLTDRRQFGRLVRLAGENAATVVEPPASDPFDVPELGAFRRLQPAQVAALGRHRIAGTVLAVKRRSTLIVRSCDGGIHDVQLAGGPPPAAGARIAAVGFPVSNMYRINLARAVWRSEPGGTQTPEESVVATPREILCNEEGERRIDARFHGRAVRMSGIVRGLRYAGEETAFRMECDGHLVEVDASGCPAALDGLDTGCRVEASGVCALETEIWSPDTVFPSISGFTLVLRTPSDVRVAARPPWWTPARLLVAVGVMFAAVVAVLVWNFLLRRVSERRGRELASEQVARVESDLKVIERTRLAVELHDALSQTLAGVSFAIDAAARLVPSDPEGASRRLASASRTLDSCRRELKNCLWDLRSNALEERDMDTAIRRTLAPYAPDDALSVRFNIPRERFTDASAHAILCIIRELALNALRHGGATHIRIAGSIDGGMLHFSVRDDGNGFDAASAPGVKEGHFGLLGIRERVDSFGGTFAIDSSPGRGCKATVSLKVPEDAKPGGATA